MLNAERVRAGLVVHDGSIPATASMIDFDDLYTAPQCGFEDAWDYYRRCSAGPHLARIAVPSVLLTAGDDPFVDPAPLSELKLSPAVHLHLEPVGGHMGYVGRGPQGVERWLDGAVVHYVDELVRARAGGAIMGA